jgi:NAD(P)-dependent dehydrogenase (short-subunit alcohol dehydrogenase family)
MEIAGTTAIVTGGASGLGAAVVRDLRARGARVAAFDLRESAVADLAVVADVASESEVAAGLARVAAECGQARILVNCAGIGNAGRVVGREGPLPLAAFEQVVRVNLVGTFNMIRLAAAAMSVLDPDAEGERGVVVSTASVAAFDGQIGQAAYAASKGGVAAMTLPMAREFARFGIRVLAIAPGLFETPMLAGLPEESRQAIAASIPFPARLGRPEEFAELVAACIANRYLNGEVIRLDGAVRLAPK